MGRHPSFKHQGVQTAAAAAAAAPLASVHAPWNHQLPDHRPLRAGLGLKDVPALRSFTAFLVQHGRHLQWLTLKCRDGTAEGEAAAAGALAACLAIAGTVGQLAQLATTGRVHSTEWLVAMPSLRQLGSLFLADCAYSAVSLGALSRLSGFLTHLHVRDGVIPGSLPALTRLRNLELWEYHTPEGDAAVVSTALPHMKQLTWLVSMRWAVPVVTTSCACPNSNWFADRLCVLLPDQ